MAFATEIINWVITATLHDTRQTVSVGACGDPTEQTHLVPPHVTSTPPKGLAEGQSAHDVLHVNGWVPAGTTTTVTIYKKAADQTTLQCTPATKVGELPPVALKTGEAAKTDYTTAATVALPAGDYGFVHATRAANGTVIAVGNCHDEPFTITPHLAHTGSDTTQNNLLGTAAALLLLTGATAMLCARRQKHRIV
ncbi:hypothetical protein IT072_03105 [Leifsonia sp. ZF2019]|uniref:hypothetical protein n=1 Tax=Leifsonia sp. ZF2019 TaxID=2781978 RepID=UPI001CBB707E|nr:hypothetical protein [Leifsonia sp. ZF2019]UAJ80070.1 hypothetical protein IT072_03105 [Leifsonia sp. ZF2019]